MERRKFISGAVIGTMGFSFGSPILSIAKGANNKVVVGLIGCGARGLSDLSGIISENDNVEVKYLCDVNETLSGIRKAIEKYSKSQGYAPRFVTDIQRLCKELELRGTLDVLPNGFTDYGVRFHLAFFKPESGLNPETIELYNKNLLHVTRQVHYSFSNENALDLLLSVNGLPIATAELKNHFTGQKCRSCPKAVYAG